MPSRRSASPRSPGRSATVGRVQRLQPQFVAPVEVPADAVRPPGHQQRTGAHGGVIAGVRADLFRVRESIGDPAGLQQRAGVHEAVLGRQQATGERGGPLGRLGRLRRLTGGQCAPGDPAERLHAERAGAAGVRVRAQPDRVGQLAGPLGVLGDERVGRARGHVEARHVARARSGWPGPRPPTWPARRAARRGRPCRSRRTRPRAAAGVAKPNPPRVRRNMRRCSSSSTARSSSTAATTAGRPGRPSAQRLERPERHDVADDRGVAQHGPGVRGQRVDAGGQHGGQVPGQQPAAEASRARAASLARRRSAASGPLVSAPRSCSSVTSSAR